MALESTPEERFDDVEDYPYDPEYVGVGDPDMAYVDVAGEGSETFLCLHGEPTWGYLYRKMIPELRSEGRVVVPDFVGFGRSDTYTEVKEYSFEMHYDHLARFVEELDLEDVTLFCQDWGSILGLPLAAAADPDRFSRIVAANALLTDGHEPLPKVWHDFKGMVVNTPEFDISGLIQGACERPLSDAAAHAYDAPFTDEDSKAGAYAWPPMVPHDPGMEGADIVRRAREALAEWDKPFFVLHSEDDRVTRQFRYLFRDLVPTARDQPDIWVEDAGHFLQEDAGEEVAEEVVEFVQRT